MLNVDDTVTYKLLADFFIAFKITAIYYYISDVILGVLNRSGSPADDEIAFLEVAAFIFVRAAFHRIGLDSLKGVAQNRRHTVSLCGERGYRDKNRRYKYDNYQNIDYYIENFL